MKAAAQALLDQLKTVPADRIADPVALADTLFRSGHPEEASLFYEKALVKDTPAETKAWLLFQMANCKRAKEPEAARVLYKRLLDEHPKSPWCPAAAVQDRLIQWTQTANPKALAEKTALAGAP
jgi:tetratricopeptide (TPR) repeat protein